VFRLRGLLSGHYEAVVVFESFQRALVSLRGLLWGPLNLAACALLPLLRGASGRQHGLSPGATDAWRQKVHVEATVLHGPACLSVCQHTVESSAEVLLIALG